MILALANPPWQRDVWLDPAEFEGVDHVFHTLLDDFCDADEPERYLGISLRTAEEVAPTRARYRSQCPGGRGASRDRRRVPSGSNLARRRDRRWTPRSGHGLEQSEPAEPR
ncbi:SCO4402 family protein [Streptomyces zaomyceticus]|uniref:SCO4402 family protein n=1 Tax=Streptomyces zaomyceticus TaxID=68286 RepID=UPI003F4DC543